MYRKRAQNLLEYVLLASVVIAVIVVCSGTFFNKLTASNGAFSNHFQNMSERMEGVKAK